MKPNQKKASAVDLTSLFFTSPRPGAWLRIWGEMILPAVLASYPAFDLFSFLKGFIATSPLLWNAAYMINDLTDEQLDRQHPVKKHRLDMVKKIGRGKTWFIILLRIFLAFLLGSTINPLFTLLLLLLLMSQIIYTLPPIRLKQRFGFDIGANGINSILRFFLGWTTQTAVHPISLAPVLFLLSLKIMLFIGHRMQNRKVEREFRFGSTIALLSENHLKLLIGLSGAVTAVSFIYCFLLGVFPPLSLLVIALGVIVMIVKIASNPKRIFAREENLDLRTFLYWDYFLVMNGIAITILFR